MCCMIYIIFHKTLKQIVKFGLHKICNLLFFKNEITFVNCLFFSNLRKYAVFISIFYPVCSRTYFEFLFINSDNQVSNFLFLLIFSLGKFFYYIISIYANSFYPSFQNMPWINKFFFIESKVLKEYVHFTIDFFSSSNAALNFKYPIYRINTSQNDTILISCLVYVKNVFKLLSVTLIVQRRSLSNKYNIWQA